MKGGPLVSAGLLNRRVTLLQPSRTVNGAGEVTESHRPVWTVWASVVQKSSDETTSDGQTVARVTYTVKLRHREDIDTRWMLDLDGPSTTKRLAISSVVEIGRREELLVTAHEVRP